MGVHVLETSTIHITDCCVCGAPIAMAESHYRNALQNRDIWFFCPTGHEQHFKAVEITRLREENARLQHRLNTTEQDRRAAMERAKWAEMGRKREKTMRLKVEQRVQCGLCPYCKRTFRNLARHMQCKHGK